MPGLSPHNLRDRVLTAVVALPTVVGLIAIGGWPLALLLGAASARAAFEVLRLAQGSVSPGAAPALLAAAAIPTLPALIGPQSASGAAFWLVSAAMALAWAWHVAAGRIEGAPAAVGHAALAVAWPGMGLLAVALLREQGAGWALLLLLATWGNDSAAYFGGRALGKRKLAPRVSPGKTREGWASGALASLLLTPVAASLSEKVAWQDALAVGAIAAIAGPLGDLSKSVLKRAAGAKDAGGLLPGHGGMLDRIDALLFNAPLALAWASWLAG